MIRKYLIPILAVAGIGFGIVTVARGNKVIPPAPSVAEPSKAPYQAFVAGSGIVDASTENIAIGTDIAGLVTKIYVQIGSRAKTGDPLFTIDDRATARNWPSSRPPSRSPRRHSRKPPTSLPWRKASPTAAP